MRTLTAVYDGQCVICNTSRRVVQFLDWGRRVEWLDLHNQAEVTRRYPQLDFDRAMGEVHVFDTDKTLYPGFYGSRRILRELPLGIPFWLLLHLPIVGKHLGPAAYRFIARNRYAINRLLGVDTATIAREEAECDENGACKLPNMRGTNG